MGLKFDQGQFMKLFPNSKTNSKQEIEYTASDAQYRIKPPTWSGNNTALTFQMDHIRGGATDDHVDLTVTFNPDGTVASYVSSWTVGGKAYQIPKFVAAAADGVIAGIGGALAGPTGGASVVVAGGAVVVVDAGCWLYNHLSKIVVKYSDNGGRLYTTPAVVHTFNRMISCVTVG
jgi:hypothetical protein